MRQDWDTRKTFPFFQIAIGWDGWIKVHFALIGITVSYSSIINEELGASRYCLFRSPFNFVGEDNFRTRVSGKGASSTFFFFFVWRARKPIALAGAVPPSLLFPAERQTALKKLCGGPPLRQKNLQLFKISSFDNIPTTRLMLDDL